jgi:Zn-dependent M28 family amino/carboxypeptidase
VRAVLIVLALFVIALAAAWAFLIRMPGHSFRGTPPPLTEAQVALRETLRRDVTALAGTIGERNVILIDRLNAAAAYIERELAAAGYRVVRREYRAEGQLVANIEAELRGTAKPEEIVVIGAHYDSVDGSPGADDNASGVAALLAIARAFVRQPHPRTIRFVAFVNEEPPYFMTPAMGSWVYVQQRRAGVVAMFSLESLAFYSDKPNSQEYPAGLATLYPTTASFIGFVSNVRSAPLLRRTIAAFREHATIASVGGAVPASVPGVMWSDQWAFWEAGIPAVMITDTAVFRNPHYHRESDTVETLDWERFTRVVDGLMHCMG